MSGFLDFTSCLVLAIRSFALMIWFSSPGYGIFLYAETTEGVFYTAEAISRPKGENGDPIVPEEIGTTAGIALLEEISRVSLTFWQTGI